MAYLPLANILHYKLRSVLSALGIGMAICMLVTLSGLSRGSLHEIADRWEAVDADLVIFPPGLGENVFMASGPHVPDAYAGILRERCPDLIRHVVPMFARQLKLGGQEQMAAGVDPADWPVLTGGRTVAEGRLFDPDSKFTRWIEGMLLSADDGTEPFDPSPADLSDPSHNGLEIVIDTRLARAGGYRPGQVIEKANHRWTIVGIVPDGGLARVYMPRRTAQLLLGDGTLRKSTLLFIKLRPGVDTDEAIDRIIAAARGAVAADNKKLGRRSLITRKNLVPLAHYRGMLVSKFSLMFRYVDAVNAVALTIAFLFIMVTLYTMVLQRRRDIAILKSSGAGDGFILRQVVAESLLLTGAGTAVGIALSLVAGWLIQRFSPLLTVRITPKWMAIAVAAAAAGAVLSALYPAWQATRVDMVETLTLE